ncbi:hypothetical protein ABS71_12450 [bacterium SCN 62-11]|nr:MAG: hypothetical protein ABS71_12450 [bacterium SCN 62-11]
MAAGCSSSQPDMDVVTSHQRQERTQVVENRRVEVTPSLELVGEPRPLPTPAQPRVLVTPPIVQPSPVQPPQPASRPMAQAAPQQQEPPKLEFQVGPPVVINTVPTPIATPSPVYQPPPPSPAPTPAYVAPSVPQYQGVLETADGMSYQNGGVNGTTAPLLPTPTPALPTAEGFEYRP